MKKALFIPLLMAASLSLASCGNNSANNKQKLEITGLGISADDGFIGAFKAENPDIDVVISDLNDNTDSNMGLKRLSASLASDSCGDIVILNRFVNSESLTKNDMLLDMNELDCIKERKDDILPNIIETYETDGKMYSMTTGFNIYSFICKTDTIDADKWNLNDFCSAVRPFADRGQDLFANHTQSCFEQILYDIVAVPENTGYIHENYEKITSMMDSMKELLEISNSVNNFNYPKSDLMNGNVLFDDEYIGNFDTYYTIKKAYFNDDITLLGSPSENNELKISPDIEFAVLRNAKHKEAAEKFISYYLSDEYQNKQVTAGYFFPVTKAAFDKEYEYALSDKCYDTDGNVIGDKENTCYVDDVKADIGIPSESDISEMYNIASSVTGTVKTDLSVYTIISERINDFWNDEISAEEYLDNLITRLDLYYSESK